MTRRPRLYFSFRSPYSWLTIHRLRQAVPDLFQATDHIRTGIPTRRRARRLNNAVEITTMYR